MVHVLLVTVLFNQVYDINLGLDTNLQASEDGPLPRSFCGSRGATHCFSKYLWIHFKNLLKRIRRSKIGNSSTDMKRRYKFVFLPIGLENTMLLIRLSDVGI